MRFVRFDNLRHISPALHGHRRKNVPSRCIRYSGHKLRQLSPWYGTAQGIRAVGVVRALKHYLLLVVVVRPGREVVLVPECYEKKKNSAQNKKNSEEKVK